MRKYEIVLIYKPNLEEEVRKKDFDRLEEIIGSEGSVLEVDEWGMRKLAYEINDLTEGYYYVVEFEATTDTVNELDRVCKLSENLMRHMIVREGK